VKSTDFDSKRSKIRVGEDSTGMECATKIDWDKFPDSAKFNKRNNKRKPGFHSDQKSHPQK
jgi:hypothetical protein